MEELLQFATDTGFAIVVAGYLLVRMEQRLDSLRESINSLTATLKTFEKL